MGLSYPWDRSMTGLTYLSNQSLLTGNFVFNSVVGTVIRYLATPPASSRSNLPPILGTPDCPPRNITDRSATVPLRGCPSRFHRH